MYTTMLGIAAFMNWRGGLKTAQGIFWFALGGVLGWPFAMALSAPFLFEEVLLASLSSKDGFIDAIMRFVRGGVGGILVLVRTSHCYFPDSNLTGTVCRVPHIDLFLQTCRNGSTQHCHI